MTRRPRAWSSAPTATSRPRSCPDARSPRPADFNAQLAGLAGQGQRPSPRGRSGCRPVDRWAADRAAMVALPPVAPALGLAGRDPAAPGPLRPPGRQRLLRRPGRGRPQGRRRRGPGHGHRHLRRAGRRPTTPGAGRAHQTITDPAHRAAALAMAAARPRAAPPGAAGRRGGAARTWATYDAAFGLRRRSPDDRHDPDRPGT